MLSNSFPFARADQDERDVARSGAECCGWMFGELMNAVTELTVAVALIFFGIMAGLSVGIVTGSLLSAITVTVGLVGVGVVLTYFFLRRMSDLGCSS